MDVYFSADVETDGPIPGPFSMLSLALVFAGTYDGQKFTRPHQYNNYIYKELRPISAEYQAEALAVNGLDRERLSREGEEPRLAMSEIAEWVRSVAGSGNPVLAAYPLGFDWTWLYWYFVRFSRSGSPFEYSRGYDIKTAVSVRTGRTLSSSSRSKLPEHLRSSRHHTHHALDDAIEQADVLANLFERGNR